MKATVKTILMLMMVVLMIAPIRAQVETGSISGTVRDTSGAAVAGAAGIAHNGATSAERSVTTGDNGQFNIPALPPGIYELTLTSTSFAKFTSRGVGTVGSSVTADPQI